MKRDQRRQRLLALLAVGAIQSSILVAPVQADLTPNPPTSSTSSSSPSTADPAPSVPLAGAPGLSLANDNSLIVQYRNIPSVSTQSTLSTALSVQSSQTINIASSTGTFNAQILDFATPQSMSAAQTSLEANSNVISVTPNLVVAPQVVPNDLNQGTQWAPAAMNLPAAWDTATGSQNTIVAVLDTGVLLTHPDLVNNLWTNPADGSHGYNYVDGNTNPTDVGTITGATILDSGHGTHVAGIIGAEGNNNAGVVGVNWHTSIMALRVCGPRYGNTTAGCYLDWVLQALQFAYDHGAQVANESFGGLGAFSSAERDMIKAISGPGTGLQKGVLVVAAAGNNGQNTTNTPFYPAGYGLSNLISVGALNEVGAKASFSNYGWNSVDVLAPGQNIYSTMASGTDLGRGQDYGYLSGTSMATPEVSGLAALIFSQHPTWTPDQVKRDIISTSTWTPALAPYAFSGGIVNAQAALAGSGTSDSLRLHFSGTGLGSLAVTGNATCSNDCNIQILPQSPVTVTGTPAANTTMTWTGTCAVTLAATPCTYPAPSLRPNISATFILTLGSGIAQTPLLTTPDTLATPLGNQYSNGSNFVATVLNPAGNTRVKVSFYRPPPLNSFCTYNSSVTGGVTVERFDSASNSWIEEAKFTAPALGDFTPGSGGTVHWPQLDNCFNFGFGTTISDDGKTLLIPLNPDLENAGTASEFNRCGVMVYKKNSSNVWDSGSLIVPPDFSYCTSIFTQGVSSTRQFNIYYSYLSGDGNTAVLTASGSQDIETMNLSGTTPVIAAPFVLPNSCRTAGLGSWNGKSATISSDGSLILIGVTNCTDNASALLLSNSGTTISLVKSLNELPFAGGTNQISAVALSGDSQTLALSYYPSPAKVVIYEKKLGVWILSRTLTTADGLTNSLICSAMSTSGDRLLCSDANQSVGYSQNLGVVESIDRISSSWSLGQPVPTLAWVDYGAPGDYSQLTGSNGGGTLLDSTVGVLRLGDGTYSDHYLGQTFTIPTQAFNNATLPSVAGNAAVGTQLTVSAGTWTGFTSGSTTLQWYSCVNPSDSAVTACTQVAGSTTSNYTPAAGDAGKYLRVLVTKTQGAVVRQVFSTATAQVLAIGAPAPIITSVSPNSGSTDGGTLITIAGSDFVSGAIVTIGGAIVVANFISATSLTATTPVGNAGAQDVTVINPDHQSATGTGLFTYVTPSLAPTPTPSPVPAPAPTITSVTPASGSTVGGTAITITGTGFDAGATVTIGGASATVGAVTSTTISATTPAGTAGARDIVVTNSDAQAVTGPGLYTYVAPPAPTPPVILAPAPTITSVTPTSGPIAGGTLITITGTGFVAGATVTIGGVSAVVGTITSTTIAVTTPARSAGAKDVVVTNIDAQSVTGTALFTYIAPAPAPAPIFVQPPPPPPIVKITPVIQWTTPDPITSDTPLSVAQLNATLNSTSTVDGLFTYDPAFGTLLSVGTHTLTATFTPADLVHYLVAIKSVSIVVTPAPVAVTPTLGGLSATYDGSPKSVSVSGLPDGVGYSITYNGSTTPPISAGGYAVEVKITGDGFFGSATGTLLIARANPVLTWNTPQPINSDRILDLAQLNATSDIAGQFTYSPAAGTILPIGNQPLSATFVPDDQNDYNTLQITVGLEVKALPPIIVPAGIKPPVLVASGSNPKGVTVLSTAQIKTATAAATKKSSVIQIFSYVKPTGKPAVDKQLSATRANAVKAQLLKASPKANIVTNPMGSTIEPSCAKVQNTCIIIKVVG